MKDLRGELELQRNLQKQSETERGLGRIMKKDGLEKLVCLRHHICCTIFTQVNLIHHWTK